MPVFHVRMTGGEDQLRTMINLLESLDGIHSVEEVADLMPHMDDADSSSAGLSDVMGPKMHEVEVDASNESVVRKVQHAMEALAFDLDMIVEFEGEDE